ncbi:hypothetical protein PL11201_490078 [Planktothrix sp. PCC 11201]|uniref:hypothetical protein n=1 Tax=Planktothrix sp. PCC 11201 TaxID=1729650 RepID=UPI00091148B0|nr:hypothetical protein [Planktothrix sp. PCC 11201]SKB11190.1 hypothetical protein PL11201_110008 [Planktothrix sp. PCC 11201]SKB13343.1 hypothetical protein PL11201_490078 [Planktothrix sp. PCC 11201]
MPIIPSNWTGQQTINAIGISGGSGFPVYQFVSSNELTINEIDTYIDLVVSIPETVNREISLDIISGRCRLFWKNKDDSYRPVSPSNFNFLPGSNFVDVTLGQLGLSIKVSEPTEIFLIIRSDKDIIDKNTEELMIPVELRLVLPTGTNYTAWEPYDIYAGETYTYADNLNKLKNSDSGTTGFKLFDIYSFYPGKKIDFNVLITNPINYGSIHLQLFDPLDIAQTAFDIASDLVNPELESLPNSFVGRLTRNAWYKDVVSGLVQVKPDFSRHVGRFVAQNINNSNAFDTCIIESYAPNADPYKGGTFVLTGDF